VIETEERVIEDAEQPISTIDSMISVEGPSIEIARQVGPEKAPSFSIEESSCPVEVQVASIICPAISIKWSRASLIVPFTSIACPFAPVARPREAIEVPSFLHGGVSREGNAPPAHQSRPFFFVDGTLKGGPEESTRRLQSCGAAADDARRGGASR
jgi:hypothetical protein